jgi:hypothetical protein
MTTSRIHQTGVLAVLAGGVATAAAYAQPQLIDLGFNGGAISADGRTVVGQLGSGGPYCRWMRTGSPAFGVITGDGLSSGQGKQILCTGDGSTIYGWVANSAGLGGLASNATLTARWTSGTGWTPLALVANAAACSGSINYAAAVSSDGRFVVGSTTVAPCASRAWAYDSNSNTSWNLGIFDGAAGESSRAYCVSTDGRVIAGTDTNSIQRPAVWEWNGSAYVETLVAPDIGTVYCMTRDGSTLVGRSSAIPNHLVTWTKVSGVWMIHDLGLPPRPSWLASWILDSYMTGVTAGGISDDGSVIYANTNYQPAGSTPVSAANIWTAQTGINDLYDYLTAHNAVGIDNQLNVPSAYGSPFGRSIGCSGDGQQLLTDGGVVDFTGGACIPASITLNPAQTSGSVSANLAVLSVLVLGSSPITYQWYRDNVPLVDGYAPWGDQTTSITGSNTARLLMRNVAGITCNEQGTYYCAISNGCGSTASSSVRLRVPNCCYANCDLSTTAPVLNVADFTCFLQEFAGGTSYANCDASTTAPVLNVADFTCFLQKFAAGCN